MADSSQTINWKWSRSILITLLGAVAIELLIFLYESILSDSETSHVILWTFHIFWEIAVLFGIMYVVKKCGISLQTYSAALALGAFFVGVIWIFIPDELKLLEANYYGVESRLTMEAHQAGRHDERIEYDFPLRRGLLYHKDDKELSRDFLEASRDNEYVRTRGFLFWQTGLAQGFDPMFIDGYNHMNSFSDRIELFFAVGPVVIVEAVTTGLLKTFPILMLMQIVWFLVRKEHVWWD